MKKIGTPLAVVIVAAVSVVFFLSRNRSTEKNSIVLSGTIEAVEVDLALETGGRVNFIGFEAGDIVSQGDNIGFFEVEKEIGLRNNIAVVTYKQVRS